MTESRGERHERALAYLVEAASHIIPPENRRDYLMAIAREVRKYSLRPRKEGEPAHEGCRHSMRGIDIPNMKNAHEAAEVVKHDFDMTYNKQRAAAMKTGFLETIRQFY